MIFTRIFKHFLFISIMLSALQVHASVLEEIKYVPDNPDIYIYSNVKSFFEFASRKGISSEELPFLMGEKSFENAEKVLAGFGLGFGDIKEIFAAGKSSEMAEKKTGFIAFMALSKGVTVPEEFEGRSVKSGDFTFYLTDKEKELYFTVHMNNMVLGNLKTLQEYFKSRKLKKKNISARKKSFLKNCRGKTFYMNVHVSDYMKKNMDNAVKKGAVLGNGLDANIFIRAILALQSVEAGIRTGSGELTFTTGLQGESVTDGKRLLMVTHFAIVGSSLALTFADMYARRKGNRAVRSVTSNRKSMETIQKFFGRLQTGHDGNSAMLKFSLNGEETDKFISALKKQIEGEKKKRHARLVMEKNSLLALKIRSGDSKGVLDALAKGTDISAKDKEGNTLMFTASRFGRPEIVRRLAGMGADVNAVSGRGLTPLHGAVMGGDRDIVLFLLEKGAETDARSNDRNTALHYAASAGNEKIVRLLAEKNADPGIYNKKGERAADIADRKKFKGISEFLKNEYKYRPDEK